MKGTHELQLGGSWQRNHVNPYNYAGQYQTRSFGFSSAAPDQRADDLGACSRAASARPTSPTPTPWPRILAASSTSVAQTFQVKDATSGYVPGIPANENYTLDNIAAYVQDNWRWKPNFTVRAGLKWEYYSPLREDDNLGFLPVINGRRSTRS